MSLATEQQSATGLQRTLYRFQVIKSNSRLLTICSNNTSKRGSREEHLVLQVLQWHLKPDTRYYTCPTALALFSIRAQSSFKLLFCIKHKIRIKRNRRTVKKTAVLCGTVKSGIELWTFQTNRFCVSSCSDIEGPLHEIRKINTKKLMIAFLIQTHAEMKLRRGERRVDEVFVKLRVRYFWSLETTAFV